MQMLAKIMVDEDFVNFEDTAQALRDLRGHI